MFINSIKKSFAVLFILLTIFWVFGLPIYAYDESAAHAGVNAASAEDIEANQAKIWKTIRSWGWSEAATAGMMGNIWGESKYDYSVTQSHVDWGDFSKGRTGLGLNQWTYITRQDALFALCDTKNVQWTDVDIQLAHLKNELEGDYAGFMVGYFSSAEEFKATTDLGAASDAICENFESPAVNNFSERQTAAKEAFAKFTGTAFDDLSAGTKPADTVNDSVEESFVVKEWDLTGMPEQASFSEKSGEVKLPKASELKANEAYSVNLIRENILQAKDSSIFDMLRQIVVTIGLVMILYATVLGVCFLFDRINVLLDLSLVTVLTGGLIKPVFEADGVALSGGMISEGYMGWRKFVKVLIVLTLFGFLLVSGGVFSIIVAPLVDYVRVLGLQ